MTGDRAARQAAVLADPDRVQLLSLLLGDPCGEASAERLAGPGCDVAAVRRHLVAMAAVGLVDAVAAASGPLFRPTHDALARFGALLGAPGHAGPAGRPGALLGRVADQLVERFAGTLSPETVRGYVEDSYDLLASRATVRTFLPVLTARFAADRLDALVTAGAPARRSGADVLFVCTRNAGRSQLAAAALRTRAGERAHVRTAGSAPASRVDPAVLAVIERRGWAAALEFPKPLTDEVVRASDYVVTMGCGDALPVVPGRAYLDWDLPDPAGKDLADVERIADEVDRRVAELLARIETTRSGAGGGR